MSGSETTGWELPCSEWEWVREGGHQVALEACLFLACPQLIQNEHVFSMYDFGPFPC